MPTARKRKKKYKLSKSRHAKPIEESKRLAIWNRRLDIFLYSTVPLGVFCVIYGLKHQSSISDFARMLTPFGAWAYLTSLFFLTVAKVKWDSIIGNLNAFRASLGKNEKKKLTDEKSLLMDDELAQTLILGRFVIEIVWITNAFLPIIYASGITNKLVDYFALWFPSIGKNALSLILSTVTYLLPGVLGNAAYDLIKKLVRLRRTKKAAY
jgi:hypothetical protein